MAVALKAFNDLAWAQITSFISWLASRWVKWHLDSSRKQASKASRLHLLLFFALELLAPGPGAVRQHAPDVAPDAAHEGDGHDQQGQVHRHEDGDHLRFYEHRVEDAGQEDEEKAKDSRGGHEAPIQAGIEPCLEELIEAPSDEYGHEGHHRRALQARATRGATEHGGVDVQALEATRVLAGL